MNVPDSETFLEVFEREVDRQERLSRLHNIEWDKEELPFYTVPMDYGTHKLSYPNYKED